MSIKLSQNNDELVNGLKDTYQQEFAEE